MCLVGHKHWPYPIYAARIPVFWNAGDPTPWEETKPQRGQVTYMSLSGQLVTEPEFKPGML